MAGETAWIYAANLYKKSSFPSYQDNPGSIRRIFSMLWHAVSKENPSRQHRPGQLYSLPIPSWFLLSDIGIRTIFLEAFDDVILMGEKTETGEGTL
jgi:hypothetical protein